MGDRPCPVLVFGNDHPAHLILSHELGEAKVGELAAESTQVSDRAPQQDVGGLVICIVPVSRGRMSSSQGVRAGEGHHFHNARGPTLGGRGSLPGIWLSISLANYPSGHSFSASAINMIFTLYPIP